MICIALGKIAVATPGTPVALTVGTSLLPPSGLVRKVEVWADPADTGKVFVKFGSTTLAALPPPSAGFAANWATPEVDGNQVSVTAFGIDAQTATQGPFVTVWVE